LAKKIAHTEFLGVDGAGRADRRRGRSLNDPAVAAYRFRRVAIGFYRDLWARLESFKFQTNKKQRKKQKTKKPWSCHHPPPFPRGRLEARDHTP